MQAAVFKVIHGHSSPLFQPIDPRVTLSFDTDAIIRRNAMNVSELARSANTTSETVRHYTDIALLRPTRNPDNHYRQYNHDDLRRLIFALQARSLGFTLADIRLLVDESEAGVSPCATTRQLIEQRLDEVNHRIEELHRLSHRMRGALNAWETHPDCAGGDERICALIGSFVDHDTSDGNSADPKSILSERTPLKGKAHV